MMPEVLEKIILPGSYRYLAQLVPDDCHPSNIPVAARSISDLSKVFNKTGYLVGKRTINDVVVLQRSGMRFLYARPEYSGYRAAALKVFRGNNFTMDIDHALARSLAYKCRFGYVLLARIPRKVNRGHGSFEGRMSVGRPTSGLCMTDRRVLDKLIGRPPKLMSGRVDELGEFRHRKSSNHDVTKKQLGKWAQAMGLDESYQLPPTLKPIKIR